MRPRHTSIGLRGTCSQTVHLAVAGHRPSVACNPGAGYVTEESASRIGRKPHATYFRRRARPQSARKKPESLWERQLPIRSGIGTVPSEAIRPLKPRGRQTTGIYGRPELVAREQDDHRTSTTARGCQLATWTLVVLVYYIRRCPRQDVWKVIDARVNDLLPTRLHAFSRPSFRLTLAAAGHLKKIT